MKKLKIGKSDIHGKGLFTGEPIRKGDLIAKVHSGIQLDPETVKYMPTQYGRFYNHDEKKFNTTNEIIGNHRYLRAVKNIPANTELTANYKEHSDMEQPENFGQGKYASFDFDKTIATDEGLAKARQMLKDGYNLFIVSARDKVTPDMVARARKAGIPEENIIATGSDEAKVRKVKQLGVEKHFDDKPEVIAALGLVGEQFKKGGGLNSKKYTRSITGTNKLFTKNNLFKKKSTKRIYDPNAKYYSEGGESGCPDGFEEDPQTGECIPIREKVEDIQEMPRPIVQKPPWYQESFVNPAAYVSGYGGGDPGMYKYGFLDSDQGNVVGGGGFGFPKPGVHLNALGVLPMSADDRQYFKGAYEAGISKDIKNLNLGLGVGTAITGYPGENGFVRDPIKLQPKLNLKYNFEDGGIIADFSRDQIQEYINGGYIVEELDDYANGGEPCPPGQYWNGTECVRNHTPAPTRRNENSTIYELYPKAKPFDSDETYKDYLSSYFIRYAENPENDKVPKEEVLKHEGKVVGWLGWDKEKNDFTVKDLDENGNWNGQLRPATQTDFNNYGAAKFNKIGEAKYGTIEYPVKYQNMYGRGTDSYVPEYKKIVYDPVSEQWYFTNTDYAKGGPLNKFAGGGASSCPKDHVWDSNTKKCVKVYTLANDQKLIDGVSNWAMHSSNPDKVSSEYNDQIKHYLYSGKYGYDPVSGTLYPLKKEQKTVADAETKKILAKQDDKAAYTQSIIDAGFDPDTFGKSKGTNVITGEEIYGDKSQEDVDKINKEAVNNFVTEGHRQAILESPFNIAANFTPMGMAAGVMQGAANLLPDVYDFAKDPSWSGAGAVGMDALMMAPAGKGIGKFLGTKSGLLSNTSKINPWAGTFEGESLLPKGLQFNKLDNPEAFYRLTKDPKNYGLGVDSYFNKGVPLTGDLANTFPKGSRAFGHRYSGPKYNQQTGKIDEYFGKDYLFKVEDESLMKPFLNFPEEHLTFYQQAKEINPSSSQHFQKDWLKGWTQIPQNKHGGLHKFIDGGQPCPDGYTWDETKQDCVSLIDTDWLSNWYANRKLPLDEISNKKYVNLMRERLPQYNPESTLLEELSNLPPVEYQDVIDDDPNNQGQLTYDKKYNPDKILLKKSLLDDPVKLNQIYNSEASTAVDVNKPGLFAAQNMVIDPGLVLFEDRWGDLKGTDRDVAEDHYNYTTDPEQDNIHSLIFEERYKRNLKPDQVLTETDINKWKSEAEASGALDRNSPNFDDTLYTLFKLAKDNKSLMNWFNQLASNDKPKTGDEPQYTKQGGSIGYKIGDEIDEATMRKLKKLGYKFQKA